MTSSTHFTVEQLCCDKSIFPSKDFLSYFDKFYVNLESCASNLSNILQNILETTYFTNWEYGHWLLSSLRIAFKPCEHDVNVSLENAFHEGSGIGRHLYTTCHSVAKSLAGNESLSSYLQSLLINCPESELQTLCRNVNERIEHLSKLAAALSTRPEATEGGQTQSLSHQQNVILWEIYWIFFLFLQKCIALNKSAKSMLSSFMYMPILCVDIIKRPPESVVTLYNHLRLLKNSLQDNKMDDFNFIQMGSVFDTTTACVPYIIWMWGIFDLIREYLKDAKAYIETVKKTHHQIKANLKRKRNTSVLFCRNNDKQVNSFIAFLRTIRNCQPLKPTITKFFENASEGNYIFLQYLHEVVEKGYIFPKVVSVTPKLTLNFALSEIYCENEKLLAYYMTLKTIICICSWWTETFLEANVYFDSKTLKHHTTAIESNIAELCEPLEKLCLIILEQNETVSKIYGESAIPIHVVVQMASFVHIELRQVVTHFIAIATEKANVDSKIESRKNVQHAKSESRGGENL